MSLSSPIIPEPNDTGASPGYSPSPLLPTVAEETFPQWSGWDVLSVLAATVLAIFAVSAIAMGVLRRLPAYRHMPLTDLATNPHVIIGSQLAAYPLVILFMIALVRSRARERFVTAIRWNWPGTSAPLFLAGGLLLAFAVDGLSRYLPIPKSLPMDKYFNDAGSAYLMAAFGITLAPLLEELFFRGLLYPLLRRAFGISVAVVLTAAAFAGIHGTQLGYAWGPVLSIFVVGVALTLVRQRTESVAASFLMHCGYNLTLFGALWIGSGHFHHLDKALG